MSGKNSQDLVLKDGSSIAVIGGGPAGSFFTLFAMDLARKVNLDISVDVIEPKNFNCTGPAGCNNCGGIVSESLIQMLAADGILLPPNVIRRDIESYTLHLEHGKTVIETPFPQKSIVSIFRGLGPQGPDESDQVSFDNFLLDLCRQKGANIIADTVVKAEKLPDGIVIKTINSLEKKYDLVVGAAGLNPKTLRIFQSICPSYTPPEVTKTHIAEMYLGKNLIDQYFGNSMHVFLLNLPKIKFGALIPKENYVTLVLLGNDINNDVVAGFLNSEEVKACFPSGADIHNIIPCQCFPNINIRGARSAFGDRIVLIGDSSSSKLFKNGLGAGYITGKAAASAAILRGISGKDFRKYYQPVCSGLDRDNGFGKVIFTITSIIQKSGMLKKGMINMIVHEQAKSGRDRLMSLILWDTFTGSAPYKNIFSRSLTPSFIISFTWHAIRALFREKSLSLPIRRSTSVLSDIRFYFMHRPETKTLVRFDSKEDRHRYSESIMQRLGIDVDQYKLLNIHRIGIEVPASYLFDELMRWNGDSICWPNHIARVNLHENKLEKILITLFGRSKEPFKHHYGFFPFRFPQLFILKALRIQPAPTPFDTDNARYFLYECSGGYPIGVFSMYVRSSIPERGESEMSQLFIMVSFNFYGKKSWSKMNFINKMWESVHNRVTANVANRFKQLCEWKFEHFKEP